MSRVELAPADYWEARARVLEFEKAQLLMAEASRRLEAAVVARNACRRRIEAAYPGFPLSGTWDDDRCTVTGDRHETT